MWLQWLPSGEVVVRGYDSELSIKRVGFEHMGEFVCKASNVVKGKNKYSQSEPLSVIVRGPPHIENFKIRTEILVKAGEEVRVEVPFCSNPAPSANWIIKLEDTHLTLSSGTRYLRIISMTVSDAAVSHCYVSVLTIEDAHPSDSKYYTLEIGNEEGKVTTDVKIIVIQETLSLEILVSTVIGGVLFILIISLVILYSVQARRSSEYSKNTRSVAGSDKTDVESCQSNSSLHKRVSIPPDSIYSKAIKTTSVKNEEVLSKNLQHQAKPDLLSTYQIVKC